jgi:hypothetical protein
MPCPFPGMDPYIERPAIWPDFHDSLITHIRGVLQPLLKPKYVALVQERLYVTESERPIYPDAAVIRARSPRRRSGGGTAVAEEVSAPPDPARVFALSPEEIREPLIHIVEPAAGERLVTAIEVLSPKNKRPGPGRRSYQRKRRELWKGGASLVEIDLLRAGRQTVRLAETDLEELDVSHYLVSVSRKKPPRREVYTTIVRSRLPRVAVPLANGDPDVTLDLQAAFTRCWDEGPYPQLLRYAEPPAGPMAAEDAAWCQQVLAKKKLR